MPTKKMTVLYWSSGCQRPPGRTRDDAGQSAVRYQLLITHWPHQQDVCQSRRQTVNHSWGYGDGCFDNLHEIM